MKQLFALIFFIYEILISTLKINAQPSITWQKTYGDGNIDYGYSIVQTPDDGFIAVGRKRINTTSYMFAMRLSKHGDTIWTKTFLANDAIGIEKLSDGNYIISGNDIDPLIKINIDGNILWSKPNASGLLKASRDSGFFIYKNYEIVKYDNNGSIDWSFPYLNYYKKGLITDYATRPDNSILIIGIVKDTSFFHNRFLIRVSNSGSFVSLINFKSNNFPSKLISTDNNKFVFGGDNENGTFLVQYDTLKNIIWEHSYDKGLPEMCVNNSLIKTLDSGYAFTGYYNNGNSDFYMRIIKTDSIGKEKFRKLFGFDDNDQGFCIRQTYDSGYVVIGIRDNYHLGDIYIVKTDKIGFANPPVSITKTENNYPIKFDLLQNYPNPFNPQTKIKFYIPTSEHIKLKIFNLQGLEITTLFDGKINGGFHEFIYKSDFKLSSGVYYCQLKSDIFCQTIKMLLIK